MPLLGTPKKIARLTFGKNALSRAGVLAICTIACFTTIPPKLWARNSTGFAEGSARPKDRILLMNASEMLRIVWNDSLLSR
jgi:hypothetical protein